MSQTFTTSIEKSYRPVHTYLMSELDYPVISMCMGRPRYKAPNCKLYLENSIGALKMSKHTPYHQVVTNAKMPVTMFMWPVNLVLQCIGKVSMSHEGSFYTIQAYAKLSHVERSTCLNLAKILYTCCDGDSLNYIHMIFY